MNCPHFILVNNRIVLLMFHTRYDYARKKWVSLHFWFNPFRYEMVLFPRTDRRITINKQGKWHIVMSNLGYYIKQWL